MSLFIQRSSTPNNLQAASKILLRCGLIPFGAWAVTAAFAVFEPCIAPEARSMLKLLGGPAPTLWTGPRSLLALAASLATSLSDTVAMGVCYDAGLVLRPLVGMVMAVPTFAGSETWGGFLFRAQTYLGRWGSGTLASEAALQAAVNDLTQTCYDFGFVEVASMLLSSQTFPGWTTVAPSRAAIPWATLNAPGASRARVGGEGTTLSTPSPTRDASAEPTGVGVGAVAQAAAVAPVPAPIALPEPVRGTPEQGTRSPPPTMAWSS